MQSRLHETEAAMSKILEQLESIAQSSNNDVTPQEATPDKNEKNKDDERVEKMTPEQLKTIEDSMQQLNELSRLYKKQKAQLEASEEENDGQDSSEEEENGIDEEMDEVQAEIYDNNNLDQEDVEEELNRDSGNEGISENESAEEEISKNKIEDSPPKATKQVRRRPKKD